MAAVLALVVSLVQGLTWVAASHAARALASAADGTGGQFVSAQGRVMDTRPAYTVGGYSTPMAANTWRTVQVDGNAGVPSSGVSAVQVSVTIFHQASAGTVYLSQNLATPKPQPALSYRASYEASNTAIVAVGSDGKIKVEASTSTDVAIDVEGYFTAGDTAAGGYVPVTPTRVVSTLNGTGTTKAQLAAGSTSTFTVGGLAGVPVDASAVFVNITVQDYADNNGGYLVPYAADASRPTVSLNYASSATVAFGTTVPLSADGKIKLYNSTAGVDVWIDVVGYFDGSSSTGAFTPAVATVASNVAITANTTKTVRIAGVAGVPLIGSGISAAAFNLKATTSDQGSDFLTVWASTDPEPTSTSSLNMVYDNTATVSNFLTTKLGNDGAIKIANRGNDDVAVTVSVQGWYTNSGLPISNGQDQTHRYVGLQAQTSGSGSWVTYQYRIGTLGAFTNIPVADTKNGSGSSPSSWPVSRGTPNFAPYTWDLRATLASALHASGVVPDTLVQVQACYGTSNTDTNTACGVPLTVNYSSAGLDDATQDVGPGTVDELTGDFSFDATDADLTTSLDDLSVGRTLTTLQPAPASADASGVFGPGWSADLSGPDAGNAGLTVTDQASSGYLAFTDTDGTLSTYAATSPVSAYPISFAGTGNNTGDGETVTKVDASTITMIDPDGTTTTWTKTGSVWAATSVKEPGSNTTSTFTYNAAGDVTRILAPVPAGVTCTSPDTTPGCRSLILSYAGTGTGTRLQSIAESIPQAAGVANQVTVANYDYDTSGRLADEYDPRITPTLKTAYTYNADGRLASLTPPGLAPWSFHYNSDGTLSTVTRPDPSGATATTTIVYGVATAGSNAPMAMDATTTGTWDETSDLPVVGAAIFSPSHQPAGTTPGTVTAADWPYAGIDYLDVNGTAVNTAAYGAGDWQITTTQYDANGNDVWDLSAGNRNQALHPTTDTDTYVAGQSSNVTRADLLASTTQYGNPFDPSEVTDTFGPTHPVTVTDGSVIHARSHEATSYDEGAPNGDDHVLTNPDGTTTDLGDYEMPTTVTNTAFNVATGTDTAGADARTTRTGYTPVVTGDPSGWDTGQPTSSTIVMGTGSDLTTYTRYDTTGRTIETRLPGDSGGTGPRTTDTTYYTATGTGTCGNQPTLSGLVCQTAPAGQPATGNPLAVVTYGYNQYGDATSKTETYGTGSTQVVRTSTISYDPAQRQAGSAITVTPTSAGGTPVPAVTYAYDTTTGLPTTTSTGTGGDTASLITGYDNLGQIISYADVTGNTSTMQHDLAGNVVATTDGKLTTNYTIGSAVEHRDVITAENIGVANQPSNFGVTYDADGSVVTQTFPNGLSQQYKYDNTESPIDLAYTKSGTNWLDFSINRNQFADPVRAVTMLGGKIQSSDIYTLDQADRLTRTDDTYKLSCTTRSYTLDSDSNRQKLDSYAPSSDGSCNTSISNDTSTSYNFDAADRLTSDTAGTYRYDSLGRTITTPADDSIAIGLRSGTTGSLSASYYSNDMLAGEQQGGASIARQLDPLQNRTLTEISGSTVQTDHYAGTNDDVAWSSDSSGNWTDNVTGPTGNMVATYDQNGSVQLLLTNLRGDVVATASDDLSATGLASFDDMTEFGAPRAAATASPSYGFLGAQQRSSANLGGLVTMGARMYNPSTGRFLSVDPIAGGNANGYAWPNNPMRDVDPTGENSSKTKWTVHHLNWQCARDGCVYGVADCESFHNRCSVVFVWYLRGEARAATTILWDPIYIVVNGNTQGKRTYSHAENGTYNWHTSFGNRNAAHGTGYYTAGKRWFGGTAAGHLEIGMKIAIYAGGFGNLYGDPVNFTMHGGWRIK